MIDLQQAAASDAPFLAEEAPTRRFVIGTYRRDPAGQRRDDIVCIDFYRRDQKGEAKVLEVYCPRWKVTDITCHLWDN